MSVYKRLFNNTIIFAVGNLGSKLISFILLPLYTTYLSVQDFGLVDLITVSVALLVPLFSLSIFDGLFRFVMDNKYDKKILLINSLLVVVSGFTALLLVYPIIKYIFPFDGYLNYFYLLLFLQIIFNVFSQYVRAMGQVKLFAFSGILNSITLFLLNLMFLVVLKMEIEGYLISLILSLAITNIYLLHSGKIIPDIKPKLVNIKIIKEMLIYSIPLIPNALLWWVMGFADRFIITSILGLTVNGLYAVANRIPTFLTIINTIFFQPWQMSAIEEYGSSTKSAFYSKVFAIFSTVMFLSTSFLLLNIKSIIGILVSDDFYLSWSFTPFLLIGVLFSSFSGFLGANYIAAKQTRGVFLSSFYGALINIILNIILIPILGGIGAAISTMISFFFIWIYRIYDTRRFVYIKINKINVTMNLCTLFVQVYVLYQSFSLEYLINLVLFVVLVLINSKSIISLMKNFGKLVFKRGIGL